MSVCQWMDDKEMFRGDFLEEQPIKDFERVAEKGYWSVGEALLETCLVLEWGLYCLVSIRWGWCFVGWLGLRCQLL